MSQQWETSSYQGSLGGGAGRHSAPVAAGGGGGGPFRKHGNTEYSAYPHPLQFENPQAGYFWRVTSKNPAGRGNKSWIVLQNGRLSIYSSHSTQARLLNDVSFRSLDLIFDFAHDPSTLAGGAPSAQGGAMHHNRGLGRAGGAARRAGNAGHGGKQPKYYYFCLELELESFSPRGVKSDVTSQESEAGGDYHQARARKEYFTFCTEDHEEYDRFKQLLLDPSNCERVHDDEFDRITQRSLQARNKRGGMGTVGGGSGVHGAAIGGGGSTVESAIGTEHSGSSGDTKWREILKSENEKLTSFAKEWKERALGLMQSVAEKCGIQEVASTTHGDKEDDWPSLKQTLEEEILLISKKAAHVVEKFHDSAMDQVQGVFKGMTDHSTSTINAMSCAVSNSIDELKLSQVKPSPPRQASPTSTADSVDQLEAKVCELQRILDTYVSTEIAACDIINEYEKRQKKQVLRGTADTPQKLRYVFNHMMSTLSKMWQSQASQPGAATSSARGASVEGRSHSARSQSQDPETSRMLFDDISTTHTAVPPEASHHQTQDEQHQMQTVFDAALEIIAKYKSLNRIVPEGPYSMQLQHVYRALVSPTMQDTESLVLSKVEYLTSELVRLKGVINTREGEICELREKLAEANEKAPTAATSGGAAGKTAGNKGKAPSSQKESIATRETERAAQEIIKDLSSKGVAMPTGSTAVKLRKAFLTLTSEGAHPVSIVSPEELKAHKEMLAHKTDQIKELQKQLEGARKIQTQAVAGKKGDAETGGGAGAGGAAVKGGVPPTSPRPSTTDAGIQREIEKMETLLSEKEEQLAILRQELGAAREFEGETVTIGDLKSEALHWRNRATELEKELLRQGKEVSPHGSRSPSPASVPPSATTTPAMTPRGGGATTRSTSIPARSSTQVAELERELQFSQQKVQHLEDQLHRKKASGSVPTQKDEVQRFLQLLTMKNKHIAELQAELEKYKNNTANASTSSVSSAPSSPLRTFSELERVANELVNICRENPHNITVPAGKVEVQLQYCFNFLLDSKNILIDRVTELELYQEHHEEVELMVREHLTTVEISPLSPVAKSTEHMTPRTKVATHMDQLKRSFDKASDGMNAIRMLSRTAESIVKDVEPLMDQNHGGPQSHELQLYERLEQCFIFLRNQRSTDPLSATLPPATSPPNREAAGSNEAQTTTTTTTVVTTTEEDQQQQAALLRQDVEHSVLLMDSSITEVSTMTDVALGELLTSLVTASREREVEAAILNEKMKDELTADEKKKANENAKASNENKKQIQQLSDKIAALEAAKAKLNNDLGTANKKHEAALKKLKDDHTAEKKKLADEHAGASNDAYEKISALEGAVKKLQDAYGAEKKKMASEIESILNESKALRADVEEAISIIDSGIQNASEMTESKLGEVLLALVNRQNELALRCKDLSQVVSDSTSRVVSISNELDTVEKLQQERSPSAGSLNRSQHNSPGSPKRGSATGRQRVYDERDLQDSIDALNARLASGIELQSTAADIVNKHNKLLHADTITVDTHATEAKSLNDKLKLVVQKLNEKIEELKPVTQQKQKVDESDLFKFVTSVLKEHDNTAFRPLPKGTTVKKLETYISMLRAAVAERDSKVQHVEGQLAKAKAAAATATAEGHGSGGGARQPGQSPMSPIRRLGSGSGAGSGVALGMQIDNAATSSMLWETEKMAQDIISEEEGKGLFIPTGSTAARLKFVCEHLREELTDATTENKTLRDASQQQQQQQQGGRKGSIPSEIVSASSTPSPTKKDQQRGVSFDNNTRQSPMSAAISSPSASPPNREEEINALKDELSSLCDVIDNLVANCLRNKKSSLSRDGRFREEQLRLLKEQVITDEQNTNTVHQNAEHLRQSLEANALADARMHTEGLTDIQKQLSRTNLELVKAEGDRVELEKKLRQSGTALDNAMYEFLEEYDVHLSDLLRCHQDWLKLCKDYRIAEQIHIREISVLTQKAEMTKMDATTTQQKRDADINATRNALRKLQGKIASLQTLFPTSEIPSNWEEGFDMFLSEWIKNQKAESIAESRELENLKKVRNEMSAKYAALSRQNDENLMKLDEEKKVARQKRKELEEIIIELNSVKEARDEEIAAAEQRFQDASAGWEADLKRLQIQLRTLQSVGVGETVCITPQIASERNDPPPPLRASSAAAAAGGTNSSSPSRTHMGRAVETAFNSPMVWVKAMCGSSTAQLTDDDVSSIVHRFYKWCTSVVVPSCAGNSALDSIFEMLQHCVRLYINQLHNLNEWFPRDGRQDQRSLLQITEGDVHHWKTLMSMIDNCCATEYLQHEDHHSDSGSSTGSQGFGNDDNFSSSVSQYRQRISKMQWLVRQAEAGSSLLEALIDNGNGHVSDGLDAVSRLTAENAALGGQGGETTPSRPLGRSPRAGRSPKDRSSQDSFPSPSSGTTDYRSLATAVEEAVSQIESTLEPSAQRAVAHPSSESGQPPQQMEHLRQRLRGLTFIGDELQKARSDTQHVLQQLEDLLNNRKEESWYSNDVGKILRVDETGEPLPSQWVDAAALVRDLVARFEELEQAHEQQRNALEQYSAAAEEDAKRRDDRERQQKAALSAALIRTMTGGLRRLYYHRWLGFVKNSKDQHAKRNAVMGLMLRGSDTQRQRIYFRTWLAYIEYLRELRSKRKMMETFLNSTDNGRRAIAFRRWKDFAIMHAARKKEMSTTMAAVSTFLRSSDRGVQRLYYQKLRRYAEERRADKKAKAAAMKRAARVADVLVGRSEKGTIASAYRRWMAYLKHMQALRQMKQQQAALSEALIRGMTGNLRRTYYDRWIGFVKNCKEQQARRTALMGMMLRGSDTQRQRIYFRTWLAYIEYLRELRSKRKMMETFLNSTDNGRRAIAFRRWKDFLAVKKEKAHKLKMAELLVGMSDGGLRGIMWKRWRVFATQSVARKKERASKLAVSSAFLHSTDRGLQVSYYNKWLTYSRLQRIARKEQQAKSAVSSAFLHSTARGLQQSYYNKWVAFRSLRQTAKKELQAKMAMSSAFLRSSERGVQRLFYNRWMAFAKYSVTKRRSREKLQAVAAKLDERHSCQKLQQCWKTWEAYLGMRRLQRVNEALARAEAAEEICKELCEKLRVTDQIEAPAKLTALVDSEAECRELCGDRSIGRHDNTTTRSDCIIAMKESIVAMNETLPAPELTDGMTLSDALMRTTVALNAHNRQKEDELAHLMRHNAQMQEDLRVLFAASSSTVSDLGVFSANAPVARSEGHPPGHEALLEPDNEEEEPHDFDPQEATLRPPQAESIQQDLSMMSSLPGGGVRTPGHHNQRGGGLASLNTSAAGSQAPPTQQFSSPGAQARLSRALLSPPDLQGQEFINAKTVAQQMHDTVAGIKQQLRTYEAITNDLCALLSQQEVASAIHTSPRRITPDNVVTFTNRLVQELDIMSSNSRNLASENERLQYRQGLMLNAITSTMNLFTQVENRATDSDDELATICATLATCTADVIQNLSKQHRIVQNGLEELQAAEVEVEADTDLGGGIAQLVDMLEGAQQQNESLAASLKRIKDKSNAAAADAKEKEADLLEQISKLEAEFSEREALSKESATATQEQLASNVKAVHMYEFFVSDLAHALEYPSSGTEEKGEKKDASFAKLPAREKIDSLLGRADEVVRGLHSSSQTARVQQKTIKKLEERVAELRAEKDVLSPLLENSQKEVRKLSDALSETKREHSREQKHLQAAIEKLESDMSDQHDLHEKRELDMMTLQRELQTGFQAVVDRCGASAPPVKALSEFGVVVTAVDESLRLLESEIAALRVDLRQEKIHSQEVRDVHVKEMNALKMGYDDATNTAKSLQMKENALLEQIQKLLSTHHDLFQGALPANMESITVFNLMETSVSLLARRTQTVDSLNKKLSALEFDLTKLASQASAVTDQLKSTESERDSLQTELEMAHKNLNSSHLQTSHLAGEQERLTNRIRELFNSCKDFALGTMGLDPEGFQDKKALGMLDSVFVLLTHLTQRQSQMFSEAEVAAREDQLSSEIRSAKTEIDRLERYKSALEQVSAQFGFEIDESDANPHEIVDVAKDCRSSLVRLILNQAQLLGEQPDDQTLMCGLENIIHVALKSHSAVATKFSQAVQAMNMVSNGFEEMFVDPAAMSAEDWKSWAQSILNNYKEALMEHYGFVSSLGDAVSHYGGTYTPYLAQIPNVQLLPASANTRSGSVGGYSNNVSNANVSMTSQLSTNTTGVSTTALRQQVGQAADAVNKSMNELLKNLLGQQMTLRDEWQAAQDKYARLEQQHRDYRSRQHADREKFSGQFAEWRKLVQEKLAADEDLEARNRQLELFLDEQAREIEKYHVDKESMAVTISKMRSLVRQKVRQDFVTEKDLETFGHRQEYYSQER